MLATEAGGINARDCWQASATGTKMLFCTEAAPSRRARFSKVEGNPDDILAQLGLADDHSQSRGEPSAAPEPPRLESSRPALGRSRRSVITPAEAESLRGEFLLTKQNGRRCHT